MSDVQASLFRSKSVRTFAIGAAALCGAAMMATTTISRVAQNGMPALALIDAQGRVTLLGGSREFAADADKIDMTPVGSINRLRAGAVKIDPCTGNLK